MLAFRRLRREWLWLAGRGWSAGDFAERYASRDADVWGYRASPMHQRRAESILAALPQARFATALEVGCAEGFLSERLARRADRVVACDLSAEAVRRARENCRALPHVEFCVADIRDGFPADGFDLCLFSDVLYYLSARETNAVLAECARRIAPAGSLVISNEWSARARRLTPPGRAFAKLDGDAAWERQSRIQISLGEAELSIGVYRRRA